MGFWSKNSDTNSLTDEIIRLSLSGFKSLFFVLSDRSSTKTRYLITPLCADIESTTAFVLLGVHFFVHWKCKALSNEFRCQGFAYVWSKVNKLFLLYTKSYIFAFGLPPHPQLNWGEQLLQRCRVIRLKNAPAVLIFVFPWVFIFIVFFSIKKAHLDERPKMIPLKTSPVYLSSPGTVLKKNKEKR